MEEEEEKIFCFKKGVDVPKICERCGHILTEGICYTNKSIFCKDCMLYLEKMRKLEAQKRLKRLLFPFPE